MPTSTASQQLFMYSTVVSDVGTVRSNNQDSAFAGEHLIAICDGMGGHAGGDTASTIAIRSLARGGPFSPASVPGPSRRPSLPFPLRALAGQNRAKSGFSAPKAKKRLTVPRFFPYMVVRNGAAVTAASS